MTGGQEWTHPELTRDLEGNVRSLREDLATNPRKNEWLLNTLDRILEEARDEPR